MFQVHCRNPISELGMKQLGDGYVLTKDIYKAHGVLVRSASIQEDMFSENLLAIARAGAGVNNIPIQACTKRGIVVFYTPGANANAVKELFLTGLLLTARDVLGGIQWVKTYKAAPDIVQRTEKEKKAFSGIEIKHKKLGIIGLGAIGTDVANTADALGMKVYGYDPYISIDNAWKLNSSIQHVTDIREIFKNCDFITVHVPACEHTKCLIGKEAVSEMKPDAVILNFSRDVVCDEDAIIQALDEGRLRKYVTDFPNPKTAGHKNCIVLPHLGASTQEAQQHCASMAVMALKDYLENGNIVHSVNFPSCNMGVCNTSCRITILHKNIADISSKLTACIENAGIPILQFLTNVGKETAYTMMDIQQPAALDTVQRLMQIEGVLKVRILEQ